MKQHPLITEPAIKRLSYWHPARFIATCGGIGHFPKASGTFASAVTLPFAYGVYLLLGTQGMLLVALSLMVIGWWASSMYLYATYDQDPKEVVIDEVVGQMLLLTALFPTLQSYLVGFVLFRIFDIFKPWPVSWADQQITGGLGVMADDILAAFYPLLLLLLAFYFSVIIDRPDLLAPAAAWLSGSGI